eukprot:917729-Alexandrium_andersonii.AAC.1
MFGVAAADEALCQPQRRQKPERSEWAVGAADEAASGEDASQADHGMAPLGQPAPCLPLLARYGR